MKTRAAADAVIRTAPKPIASIKPGRSHSTVRGVRAIQAIPKATAASNVGRTTPLPGPVRKPATAVAPPPAIAKQAAVESRKKYRRSLDVHMLPRLAQK